MNPFFILGSLRSRTAWLSTWLSDDRRVCWHDLLAKIDDPLTLKEIVGKENGTVETAGAFMYRTLYDLFPNARFAIVRRDEREIGESLRRHGIHHGAAHLALTALTEAETWLSKRTKILAVDFADLSKEATLASLWNHVRADAFDRLRARRLMAMRIEKVQPFWTQIAPSLEAREASLRQMVK